MTIQVQFKNIKHSDRLIEYFEDRCQRLTPFLGKSQSLQVHFSMENKQIKCSIRVLGHNVNHFAVGLDLDHICAIDLACDRLTKQLKKANSHKKDHNRHHETDRVRSA